MDVVTLALAKSYINKKINEEGIGTGATPQQAAQIEQNKTDIADLQAEIENKQPKGDYVKTVNGNKPDASGNVVVATGGNGSGQNVDLTGYAKEAWVQEGFQPKGNYASPDDIPVVPTWAMQSSKPTYTASEVGADSKGTAAGAVSAHNTSNTAHNDIRQELAAINARLTAFFDSDNQTLDELSEIVAYITSNKSLIDAITTSKVSVADIVNNLTTNLVDRPLAASMGVELKRLIDQVSTSLASYQPKGDYALASAVPTKVSQLVNDTGFLTEHQDISGKLDKNEAFDTRQTVSPDYTNLFADGYESGKELTVTGGLTDGAFYVSDFVPVKKGDIIRIKDSGNALTSNAGYIALYKADKETADGIGRYYKQITGNAVYGTMTVSGDVVTWDTSNISYYSWNDFAYMRVTVRSPDSVITVNQELTESIKEELVLKPTVKVTPESFEGETSGKPLTGKTVVCFGDSLFGMYRGADSAPAMLAEYTGATVHNVGFGGCRMSVHPTSGFAAFSMWALAKAIAENNWEAQGAQASRGSAYFTEQLALLKSIDFSKVDMVVIHYGTNDFAAGGGTTIDNASDPDDYNTLCGALRYSIEKLLGAYPKLQIYVSLPVYRFWTENNVTTYAEDYVRYGHTLPDFVEALRDTAAEYNLPVIDGFHGMGVNKHNASAYLSDGTHHNADGRKLFGEYIGGHLISKQTAGSTGINTDAVNVLISAAIGDAIGGSY